MSLTPSSSEQSVLEATATNLTSPNEGWSSTPYQDPGGIWTIGFGSTYDLNGNKVTEDTPAITKPEGIVLLERELTSAYQIVNHDVKVSLTDEQQEALYDFVFNVGQGNFEASTLLKYLNQGLYEQAAQQLILWNQQKGVVLAGLLKRRYQEETTFISGTTLAEASEQSNTIVSPNPPAHTVSNSL
jgi:lysozyme